MFRTKRVDDDDPSEDEDQHRFPASPVHLPVPILNKNPIHNLILHHHPPRLPTGNLDKSDLPLPQLVLLDLQSSLQNLLSLGSSDSSVNGNLFVPSDRERSDSVSCLGCNGGLTSELFQDLGCSSKSITGLSYGDVCDVSFPLYVALAILTD
jgi:hypothetical protein